MSAGRYRTLGVLSMGLAAILWGTIGPIIKLFPEGSSFQYALFRNVIGSIVLWGIVAFSKTKTRYIKSEILPILISGFGAAGFMSFYMLSFSYTGVAVASVVSIGLSPIFVGLLSWVLFKNAPGKIWAIGTFFGVVGVTTLNWPSGGTQVNLIGFGFAALAAFSYSCQALALGVISKRHGAAQTVAPPFTVAAFVFMPIAFGRSFEFLSDPVLVLGVIYGGMATIGIASIAFAYGVNRIGPANAVTVGLLEPITAATMGVALLGEKLTSFDLFGIALVLIGLVIVSRPPKVDARILVEP